MEPIFAFFYYLWSRLHSSPVIETIGLDRNPNGEVILPSSQHYQPCAMNMFPAETEDDQTNYPIWSHSNRTIDGSHGNYRIFYYHQHD